jgi:hypothetical protein
VEISHQILIESEKSIDGIHEKVHLWHYGNQDLLWNNMVETWNSVKLFGEDLPTRALTISVK